MWFGIWDTAANDWLREDQGTGAVLAYDNEANAQKRAAVNFGYANYDEARGDDWCEVRPLIVVAGCPK